MKRILYILMLLPLFAQGQTGVKWDRYFFTGSMRFGAGLLGYANATLAQQDSNSFAESCAWLELGNDTTNRGLLLPRVLHRDSVASPKKGLLVFEHVSGLVLVYDGSAWDTLSGGSGGGADSSIFLTVYDASQTYQPLGTYITTETDPIFTASDAFGVTNSLISNWNAAYNDKINSLAFTGTGTKTLTLTQQDGGMVSGSFTDDNTTYTAGTGIGIVGTVISNTGDLSNTNELQTFNQTLALDSVGLHQLGISNPNASIAAHFQGNNTNYRMAINTSSNGAGLQGYNNALNAVRMITIQGGGGNVRIGPGVDNGTGIQLVRQVRMDSLTTGTGSDSLIVVNGGILKKVEPPSLTGYVPYTGATTAVDLGIHNLTTLGRVSGAIVRFTNPISYTDVTSSATVSRSNTLPDRSGEILVPSGTATNGYVIQSNLGVPTWTAPVASPWTFVTATTTTNNSTATIYTLPSLSSGQTMRVRVNYVTYVLSGPAGAVAGEITFLVQNNGSASIVGTSTTQTQISGAPGTYTVSGQITGTTPFVRVVSTWGANASWTANIEYIIN